MEHIIHSIEKRNKTRVGTAQELIENLGISVHVEVETNEDEETHTIRGKDVFCQYDIDPENKCMHLHFSLHWVVMYAYNDVIHPRDQITLLLQIHSYM